MYPDWDRIEKRRMYVADIVERVAEAFPSFGRGSARAWNNPVAAALEDKAPMFAMGVDIEQVVRFVLNCKDE